MRILMPVDPKILIERVTLENEVKGIIIAGREEKITNIARVVKSSEASVRRGICDGDIIITRSTQNPSYPVRLTDDNKVPYDSKMQLEIIDPSMVEAVYKETETELYTLVYTKGE